MKRKWIWGLSIGLVMVLALLGGRWWTKRQHQMATKEKEADYEFTTISRQNLSLELNISGRVTTSKSSIIYTDHDGTVGRVEVRAGDEVEKGSVLLVLNTPDLRNEWLIATSNAKQAELNLEAAEQNLNELEILAVTGGATENQVKDAQIKVKQLREQLKVTRLKLEGYEINSDATATVDETRQHVLIHAPFKGKVAWVDVRQGDKVASKTVLLTVVAEDSRIVEATVDETEIGFVQPGQMVEIFVNDPTNSILQGKISEVGGIGREEQGVVVFPLRVKVGKEKQEKLRPGMTVDLTVIVEKHEDVLAVPIRAITERRGKTTVPLWEDNEVVYARVETGVTIGEKVEVLSGLNEGAVLALAKTNSVSDPREELKDSRLNFPVPQKFLPNSKGKVKNK